MIAYYVSFFLFSLIYATYHSSTRTFKHWKKKGVVGPDPIPLFGNLKESALRRKHVAVIYNEIYDKYPEEKYVGIYKMTSPSLLIRDLDIVKQILIKDFEIFPFRGIEFSKEGLGDNLFHADSETWRALRHKVTPYFTSKRLKNSMYLLKDYGDKLIRHLEDVYLEQPEQEALQLFRKYTIATTMAFAFGIQVDTFKDNTEIFEKLDKSLFEYNYLNEVDFLFPGVLMKLNFSIFNKFANKFCYEVVEAVKYQKGKKPTGINNVMDLLLSLKVDNELNSTKQYSNDKQVSFRVTDHVLAGQVFVFYAAGYGNTSIVLSNVMNHLAKNPDIQNRLVQEIENVLQRYGGEITYESLKEMKYLDYVFYETLRIHPTTNSISRCAVTDYTIPGTDVTIAKGTTVVISPLAIHYDENIYPKPKIFDPERFTPENSKDRHSCAYLPFGAGPRECFGKQFAKMQFKVCVIKFMSKFRVEPAKGKEKTFNCNPKRWVVSQEGGTHLNIIARR